MVLLLVTRNTVDVTMMPFPVAMMHSALLMEKMMPMPPPPPPSLLPMMHSAIFPLQQRVAKIHTQTYGHALIRAVTLHFVRIRQFCVNFGYE